MTSTTTLGELADGRVLLIGDGYRTKRSELGIPGYRILRVADVSTGSISPTGPDFVAADYKRQIGAKLSQDGDVILTTKGTVGRVTMMPVLSEPIVYSPQLCFFRVLNRQILEPRFLQYWFRSDDFWSQASHRMNNTDMAAYINLADVRSLNIALPHISDQRAIADVLGALDDKIAANASLICTADELATVRFQALVAEEAEGRPLSSLAQFVNGRAFTKGASGTGRVVIRIAELNSGLGNSTVYNDIDVADHHLARPGDLLFAWSGSLTVHRWYRAEGIVNQHIFKVIPSTAPLWVVSGALRRKLAEFQGIAADKATTMGHIQRHHLDEAVLVPTASTISANDDAMSALWDRALQAERETLHLEELRDTLLPELMSGRLRAKDAETVVGKVV